MNKLMAVLLVIAIMIGVSALLGAQAQGIIHYDDEDGHREPWSEWKDTACVSEPVIWIDSSNSDPSCNPYTNKGVTVWACHTELPVSDPGHLIHYTTHWYCPILGTPISKPILHTFLPFVSK